MQSRFTTKHRSLPFILACTAATLPAARRLAQDADTTHPPAKVTEPSKPATPAATSDADFSPEEIRRLRASYEAANASSRIEMVAYYRDLDIDLETILGISKEKAAETQLAGAVAEALIKSPIRRAPKDVLATRAALALEKGMPAIDLASPFDISTWLTRRATAGSWTDIGVFLAQLPPESSRSIGNELFESLAAGDPQVLPEEILDIALMLPHDLTRQNVLQLARMLAPAAKRHGSAALLSALRPGNHQLGAADENARRRALDLLVSAGLVREAAEFLPPLDQARASSDAGALLAHAAFLSALAHSMAQGPEAEDCRRRAFTLLSEVPGLASATRDDLRAAIERGAELMPLIPRTHVDPWLRTLFADPDITRLAAEVLALQAATVSDRAGSVADRTEAFVHLSHAVEVMLESSDSPELRIPLRALAIAIVQQLEQETESAQTLSRWQFNWKKQSLQRLLTAAPGRGWLSSIEPSVATRVIRATITARILTEEMDPALDDLRLAITLAPGDGPALAEHFLSAWRRHLESNLSSARQLDDDDYYEETITRGHQRRRLAALAEVIDIIRGLGIDAASLEPTADLFIACHQQDEIFRLEDVERVFGTLDQIPPLTNALLADRMRETILRYWDARVNPPKDPRRPKTPSTELLREVNRGYDTALAIIHAADAAAPDLWTIDATHASVAYDRLQFNKRIGAVQPVDELELTMRAFAAFESAAASYAASLNRGEQAESTNIYARWFRAALGASDVSALHAETLPTEASAGDMQFTRIRDAILSLPSDVAYRHAEAFIAEIMETLPKAAAQVKPRLVRTALRVTPDHPTATVLRQILMLYEELASEEIKLRMTIDGGVRVQTGKPFMAVLSLRFTNAVNRSSHGFSQYLQNERWSGKNHKDDLERAVRQAFSKGFDVRGIEFFDAGTVAHAVVESGEDGWLELPLLVVYAAAKDPSIDRLPRVEMQIYMQDSTGEVAFVLPSNTPVIHVSHELSARPAEQVEIIQTLDTRAARDSERPEITLEITALGRGVIPDLDDLLDNCAFAAPGFVLSPESIEARPIAFIGERPFKRGDDEPTLPVDEKLGIARPRIERSWLLRYTPDGSAGADSFTLPTLAQGVSATLTSRAFGKTNFEPILAATYPLKPVSRWPLYALAAAAVALLAFAIPALLRITRRRKADAPAATQRILIRRTPSAAILTLRKLHADAVTRADYQTRSLLETDIATLERDYFSGSPGESPDDNLGRIASRWDDAAARLARRTPPAHTV